MFLRRTLLHTSLARERLISLFRTLVGNDDSQPFGGQTDGDGFRIDSIRTYRSAFLPRIDGRYVEGRDGVDLRLTMRPHRQVVVFLAVWAIFLILLSSLILIFSLPDRPGRLFILSAPFLLGIMTFFLSSRVFQSDCRWSLKFLEETLCRERLP